MYNTLVKIGLNIHNTYMYVSNYTVVVQGNKITDQYATVTRKKITKHLFLVPASEILYFHMLHKLRLRKKAILPTYILKIQ